MAAPLQCRVLETDQSLYLCLEGDLDDKSFLQLSRAFADRELDLPVKVDLEKVRYANSTGIRALVLLQRQAREAGVDFTLVDPSEEVKRIFRSTGLSEVFHIGMGDPENPC
ncbi:MAG: STAS domain-containing protein [Armatimonadetes bacterium]|nr:STAS domain-containing protein [Armatimonadota bacterium]